MTNSFARESSEGQPDADPPSPRLFLEREIFRRLSDSSKTEFSRQCSRRKCEMVFSLSWSGAGTSESVPSLVPFRVLARKGKRRELPAKQRTTFAQKKFDLCSPGGFISA
jgi:hypothetical protein